MAFDKAAFGAKLAELRKKAGLTQLVAARMLGVTDKAVSKWEKGGSFPSMETLVKISELYHVQIGELFEAAERNTQRIVSVVLTGGPCSGKSSASGWIVADMQKKGWRVVFVPETATELINAGVSPKTCGSQLAFQRCVMGLQAAKEEQYRRFAAGLPNENVLLVFDRGVMDSKAYLRGVEFAGLLRENGLSEVEARDRYDAVFHLVSTAKDDPERYENTSNAARREMPARARALDDKTLRAWKGHPRLRIIGNTDGLEGKLKRLIAELSDVTGTPGPRRLQRKYLVEMPNLAALEGLPGCAKVEAVQTYLKGEPGLEVRVRRRGSEGDFLYTKTVKEQASAGVELRRIASEERLTEAEYLAELANADPDLAPLRKTRYCLCEDDRCLQLDVFPFWKDRAMLEVPVADKNEEPVVPKIFKVIEEVTDDPAYRNYNLAKTTAKNC